MMNNDPLAELIAAGKSPPEITAAVAADAEVIHTPCGDGNLVWRRWGKGKGAPVVLVHGGSGSWTHWIKNITGLAERGEVWAGDLPGLGVVVIPGELRVLVVPRRPRRPNRQHENHPSDLRRKATPDPESKVDTRSG